MCIYKKITIGFAIMFIYVNDLNIIETLEEFSKTI